MRLHNSIHATIAAIKRFEEAKWTKAYFAFSDSLLLPKRVALSGFLTTSLDRLRRNRVEKSYSLELPSRGSCALRDFLWTNHCDLRLFHFTIDVVLKSDYAGFVVKSALDGSGEYKNLTPVKLAREKPGVWTQRLRQQSQELLEMFLNRLVDNFQVWLVEVIRLALHAQPRILSERKQELSLGDILKHESIDSLAREIVEKKLTSLSYEGFGEIESWCQSKAIPFIVPEGSRQKLIELVALRNIIVHSRGIVDEKFKAAVPGCSFTVGQKRLITVDDYFEAADLFQKVAQTTDYAIAGKFALQLLDIEAEIKARSSKRWPPAKEEQRTGGDVANLPSQIEQEHFGVQGADPVV